MAKEYSSEAELRTCRELIKSQKYSEARTSLQKLLEIDPKEEDAFEMLGMISFIQKDMATARECFEKLTQLNPSNTKAWVNLGAIYNRSGDHKKATEVLRRALQRDRKCAEAYYNMGIAQRALQMNTMAISAYKEALKLAPDMVDASINLGNIYMDMKNIGFAIQCFTEAIKHQPNSEKAQRCLERAQSQQKSSRKEASPFGRLVNIDDLAKQQQLKNPRQMDHVERTTERNTIEATTKTLRSTTKEYISHLETILPQSLHRIKIAILHIDEHIDATDLLTQLATEMENIKSLQESQVTARHEMIELMNVNSN